MSSSSGTHPSVVEGAKLGEPNAWARIVGIYTPMVEAWCQRLGCDVHTSQDIAQETFLAASQAMDRFRADGTTGVFRRWLWQIARNKLIDYRRRNPSIADAQGGSTAAMSLQQIPEVGDSSVIDPSSPDMLRDLVLKAMKSVRVEFRECSWKAFWRTAVDGLPTDMVANELGMSVAAIRQARSRIMRRLREELGDC